MLKAKHAPLVNCLTYSFRNATVTLIFVYYTVDKPQQLQVTMIYIRYTKTIQ